MKNSSLLTIAGSDSGGGAGVAVTSQNTLGVQHVFALPAEVVVEQLESIFSDFDVGFAKTGMLYNSEIIHATGMLYNSEIIHAAGKYLKKHDVSYVVDPVMSAEAGGNLLSTDALLSLARLGHQQW